MQLFRFSTKRKIMIKINLIKEIEIGIMTEEIIITIIKKEEILIKIAEKNIKEGIIKIIMVEKIIILSSGNKIAGTIIKGEVDIMIKNKEEDIINFRVILIIIINKKQKIHINRFLLPMLENLL
jgi:hypothetical protein